MQTRIIIEHTDTAALKAHPLWEQFMSLFLCDGPVQVVEIEKVDEADEVG